MRISDWSSDVCSSDLRACLLPLLLGFLLPAGVLLVMAIKAGDQQFCSRYLELVGNSVTLAAVTALLAVCLAALMAYGRRLQGRQAVQLANRLAAIGYALHCTTLASGLLVPFPPFDNPPAACLTPHSPCL